MIMVTPPTSAFLVVIPDLVNAGRVDKAPSELIEPASEVARTDGNRSGECKRGTASMACGAGDLASARGHTKSAVDKPSVGKVLARVKTWT